MELSLRYGVRLTLLLGLASCTAGESQRTESPKHGIGNPLISGGCEAPASANHGKFGCYFDESIILEAPPRELFYHVDEFEDRASAERARTPGSVVVDAYGRLFLETVSGDASWRPPSARRIATVGPMPAPASSRVTARFMQAMTRPGAKTRPHSHDGPEAFHIFSGAICMETPDGAETTVAGQDYWIRGDVPMQLSSTGTEVRRSLFVVLHPSSRPWMNISIPWTPSGRCQTA